MIRQNMCVELSFCIAEVSEAPVECIQGHLRMIHVRTQRRISVLPAARNPLEKLGPVGGKLMFQQTGWLVRPTNSLEGTHWMTQ